MSPLPTLRTLQVSRATAGFIARGHPWVRPDRFTRGLDRLACGEAVTLVDEQGRRLASALADPQAAVCARVHDPAPDRPFAPAEALARAWERRAPLHQDTRTDCYRVVHGEADGLPGLRVERYADVLVVLVLAACATPAIEPVCAALAERLPGATIVVREHRQDLRREQVVTRRRDGLPLDEQAVVEGRELGVRVPLRPFAGLATGIYVDQRATRAWLRERAEGLRVLNLFAYTGLFSVSLLTAGAASALDVDLSGPALARAQETATLNGVADRYAQQRGDCLAMLENAGSEAVWDLIIVDPPTAAQGGGGWVVRRDLPVLLEACLRRLAPGGLLVACCNTLGGKPFPLAQALDAAAAATAIAVAREPTPALALDIPQQRGFPEGRPYQLAAIRRR